MQIARDGESLRRWLAPHRGLRRIALVPTMGCLHQGHLQLIRAAREQADIVVVSIYVNPLQFAAGEDLDRYPRTFAADAEQCAQAGVDLIFHPHSLYAGEGPLVSLRVRKLADMMCGASRPGHFDGVATVVNILFNLVQPDIAIFGEKDWQQLTIIRRMTDDLQMPVQIIGMPTVREADGLAMSSRNRYLSDAERRRATILYRALTAMQQQASRGESDCARLLQAGHAVLQTERIEPEYLDIRHADTLEPLSHLQAGQPARALIAARIGNARLIDNMPLAVTEALS